MADSRQNYNKHKAIDLMRGQFYEVKTVLDQYDAGIKMFLAFKDSPGDTLGRSVD